MTAGATIGVVDYGMGNRRSVEKAFEHVGATVRLSDDPRTLREAGALVIPGVGAFPQGMENLRRRGLDELILERAAAGIPLLGICLGMQLLFETSDEVKPTRGLGLIPGHVSALEASDRRIPHIGWNLVRFQRPSPLTATLPASGVAFYHVHSFAARPAHRTDTVATADYGERFATIVERANVFGVQFHPEKSSRDGLEMLRAFTGLAVRETAAA